MRIANLAGRLAIIDGERAIDVERASGGRFEADPQAVFDVWDEFLHWAPAVDPATAEVFDPAQLGAPAPRPSQIFAIGLNYADHADESGMELPPEPAVFTKFQSCLAGPHATVELPTSTVDWEAELVVVVGREARGVPAERAWDHVAGLTVGQDISERTRQLVGTLPQFSLGKSFPGFGPTGPYLVTADELADPDDLEIGCSINGEVVQSSRTRCLIFSVPALIERISAVLPLRAGDLIFTGTPSGVGNARSPKRFLTDGDVLETWVGGIGRLRNILTAQADPGTDAD
jgi:2-keto-4-pentenoate hydratase/2-oxohepta-3-ene-1,7-dioic acid hydratase in catechol pathway